jgi:cell division protein FtsL
MVLAATVCILVALVALVNIEAWRRRTVAEMRAVERRRAARERAWEAVTLLEREAA